MEKYDIKTPILNWIYQKEKEYSKLAKLNMINRQTWMREDILRQMAQINREIASLIDLAVED